MTAPGGAIIPVTLIERMLIDELRAYLPFYLARAEEAMGYDPGTLQPIRTWGTPRGWLQRPTASSALPFVAFTSPGQVAPPRLTDREYVATWRMEATCGVAAKDFDSADRLAKAYGAAIAQCVLNQPPGEPVDWIDYLGDEFPIAGADEDSVVVHATELFTVKVAGVLQRRIGLTEPPDDPLVPPDEFPTVKADGTELTVVHQD